MNNYYKTKSNSNLERVQLDRIDSIFHLEDYIANTYNKYLLIKYDIIGVNNEVTDYYDFVLFIERLLNNKRMKKDIDEFLLANNYCIDINLKRQLHMHLFLYCCCNWITGNYEVDKRLFKDKIINLNKWMVKLIRNTNSPVSGCIINIPDERTNLVEYLTDISDINARNDNRVWATYLSDIDVDYIHSLNRNAVGRLRLFGRSNIPVDYIRRDLCQTTI